MAEGRKGNATWDGRSGRLSLLLVSLFACAYAANYILYVLHNPLITVGDPVSHFITAVKMYLFIQDNAAPATLSRILLLQVTQVSPPLVYLFGAGAFAIYGISWNSALLSLLPFHLLLIAAVYLLGARLWSPAAGLLASLLTLTSPLIVNLSRYYFLDIPVAAAVTLILFLLLASSRFENRRASLAFGIAVGLGLLVKWSVMLYVMVPLAWTALHVAGAYLKSWPMRIGTVLLLAAPVIAGVLYIPDRFDWNRFPYWSCLGIALLLAALIIASPRVLRAFGDAGGRLCSSHCGPFVNLADASAAAITIASSWYLFNTHLIWDNPYVTLCVEDFPRAGTLSANLWYLVTFAHGDPLLLICTFFAAASLLRDKASRRRSAFLWLALGASYVAVSLIHLKFGRYLVPLIPMAAVLTASWLTRLGAEKALFLAALLTGPSMLLLTGKLFTYPLIPDGFSPFNAAFSAYSSIAGKTLLLMISACLCAVLLRRWKVAASAPGLVSAVVALAAVAIAAGSLYGASLRVYDANSLFLIRKTSETLLTAALPPGDKLLHARPLDVGEIIPSQDGNSFMINDAADVKDARARVMDGVAAALVERAIAAFPIVEADKEEEYIAEQKLNALVFIFKYFYIIRAPKEALATREISTAKVLGGSPVEGRAAVIFYRTVGIAEAVEKKLGLKVFNRLALPEKGCYAALGVMSR